MNVRVSLCFYLHFSDLQTLYDASNNVGHDLSIIFRLSGRVMKIFSNPFLLFLNIEQCSSGLAKFYRQRCFTASKHNANVTPRSLFRLLRTYQRLFVSQQASHCFLIKLINIFVVGTDRTHGICSLLAVR